MAKTKAKNKYMVICATGNKRVNADSYEIEGTTAYFYHQVDGCYYVVDDVESVTEVINEEAKKEI